MTKSTEHLLIIKQLYIHLSLSFHLTNLFFKIHHGLILFT